MEVIICPNAESAAQLAVDLITKELTVRPDAALGLATGRTMEAVYERLVQVHQATGLNFSRCHTFNLDEYVGLAAEDPNSYRHFMRDRLFRRVDIDLSKTHLLNGAAADPLVECANYEQLIAEVGGIDLQLLGIGMNGHLGFNEPGSSFDSRTRMEMLSPVTRQQNAQLFPTPDQVPTQALTMGIATIMEARHCLLLATGIEKSSIVAQAIEGPVTEMVTASTLQYHLCCTVVLDEAAASQLKQHDRIASASLTKGGGQVLFR